MREGPRRDSYIQGSIAFFSFACCNVARSPLKPCKTVTSPAYICNIQNQWCRGVAEGVKHADKRRTSGPHPLLLIPSQPSRQARQDRQSELQRHETSYAHQDSQYNQEWYSGQHARRSDIHTEGNDHAYCNLHLATQPIELRPHLNMIMYGQNTIEDAIFCLFGCSETDWLIFQRCSWPAVIGQTVSPRCLLRCAAS